MINKDSKITKEFIKSIFIATHKRSYVEHALNMTDGDELKMEKIIEFINSTPDVLWQDIEYQILIT